MSLQSKIAKIYADINRNIYFRIEAYLLMLERRILSYLSSVSLIPRISRIEVAEVSLVCTIIVDLEGSEFGIILTFVMS